MPDCILTALKIRICFDDVLKQFTLYSGFMKHYTLFKHKAINILDVSLSVTVTIISYGHDQTELIKFCISIGNICYAQHSNTSKFNFKLHCIVVVKKKRTLIYATQAAKIKSILIFFKLQSIRVITVLPMQSKIWQFDYFSLIVTKLLYIAKYD